MSAVMNIAPHLLFGRVSHQRLTPKINAFSYGIYYLACPLSQLDTMPLRRNRPGLLAFYDKDHVARNGTALLPWIKEILAQHDLTAADGEIILITLPRVLGYVFNPVSFWLCHDRAGGLRAVLCEVNNTFGESHNYLCAPADRGTIKSGDWLIGAKFFHVSPFMKVEGHYRFRFHCGADRFGAWIDHTDACGQRQLLTSLTGRFAPMTQATLRYAFWRYPLVTVSAIALIHWQAARLLLKGVRYVPKPPQRKEKLTGMQNSPTMPLREVEMQDNQNSPDR